MNNKGFTLIELIVTIALLAIIAVISFVSIGGVLEDSKVKDCENLVSNIKSATKEYVSNNRYSNSFDNDGDKKEEITADELINNNYLSSSITNPFDNSETIAGSRIGIEILLEDDYTVKEITLFKDSDVLECVKEKW